MVMVEQLQLIMERIEIIQGDITRLQVDAIINPNNTNLISNEGKGVNGAVIAAGGNQIKEELQKIVVKMGECPPGQSVLTQAGNMPSRFVIHTVSPVWRGGDFREETLLTDCYDNSLRLAVSKGLKTVAFPNLGTGNYQFPKDIAAEISVGTIHWFLRQEEGSQLEKVILVCHNEENFELCTNELNKIEKQFS